MAYIIGIDIGTGSAKATAVNTSGQIIETSQVVYPILQPEPTYSEQDPEVIWQAFSSCINIITTSLSKDPSGIVLSSAMHSVIPVDAHGVPLMNMITWADNRSASIAERIKHSPQGEAVYTQSGTPIHAMTPLCKILWLKENASSLFTQVSKYLSIKEFIWFKLFGVYETDYSIASATGLFNIRDKKWNQQSLELCGIEGHQLGNLVPTDYERKGLQLPAISTLKISPGTPFIIGASDGCMANMGSFAIEPGTAALTIGTSGAIRVACKKPTTNFKAMIFNYPLVDDIFISGGPINNGGVTLKWYAESFLKVPLNKSSDYDNLLAALEKTDAGANGLVFLPYLLGERAPVWSSDASGVFFGIRNYHTQDHFTRSVVEGVSMALYSIMKALEESGLTVHKVHVSGGFVHSTGWLQIISDIFNKPIILIHEEDASAIGAAYLGLKVLGFIKDYHALDTAEHSQFLPDVKNHERYQKIFKIYESIYANTRDQMGQLAQFKD